MDILGKYKSWEESLKKEYESLWPNLGYLIWDGVISPIDYFKSDIKIMFLNREAYDKYSDSYYLHEAIKNQIDENLPIFGGESLIKNITKNRLRVLSLLDKDIVNITDADFEYYMYSYSEEEFRKDLHKVAYCNIKKSDGSQKSNKSELYECALKNKEILQKQISFFNPSIIIGGNIVDRILVRRDESMVEWGDDLYTPQSNYVNVFSLIVRGKEYPFVDSYHPSWPKLKNIDNCRRDMMELFNALKSVEKERPGYWKNRCGLRCFDI